ncbi:MAG: 3-oxoacyl-ACP synthase [[Candidatus Thermochlorobacteriaceae] bacterium GBChlB]|nr:MAG: 3-oxoacyl-ACP synthase [[Candidatus Thermochlorobacteriaceae] bacterium GBChlB]
MNNQVYITAAGKFLPGSPVGNDEIEQYLGMIGGKPSRVKHRILKQNGIQTRYYALDKAQTSLYSNSEMAALAVRDMIERAPIRLNDVDFLAAATTQGDLMLPGFASMIHGELKNPSCEIASFHSVCASGMMAMKSAYLQVKSGEKRNAVSVASEFPSRFLKASHYEQQRSFVQEQSIPFDTEFLRWMLSDGAGATLLQDQLNPKGISLRVEWITLKSHADKYDVCMYAGSQKDEAGTLRKHGWMDYADVQTAASDGAINLKQDIRLLENIVKIGVDGFFELIDKKMIAPSDIDWLLFHYSSHFFKGETNKLLHKAGVVIPDEKWFTNLYTKGNTGSASIYIMLEELLNDGHLKPNQKVLCIVPESGRFIVSFMLLTAVAPNHKNIVETKTIDVQTIPEKDETARNAAPELVVSGNENAEWLVRQLARVWIDFDAKLNDVPILQRLSRGKFTIEDYKLLLLNLRQQVMEGARWIARAASSFTIEAFELRSIFIGHAKEEHRDYQMLDRDYVSVGGVLEEITSSQKNIGSEALSAWMFHRASQENPFDLLGAMYIIEGLGNRKAALWGEQIKAQLGLNDKQVSFLLYHGANDDSHFDKLEQALSSPLLTRAVAEKILKTAKVTARLYLLQLEELGNY